MIKTELAKRTRLGDPFFPRIADAFFMSGLLLDKTIRGRVVCDQLSRIRLHGSNDLFYGKFDEADRCKKYYSLSLSEILFFSFVLERADSETLRQFLQAFLDLDPSLDETEMLVEAAVRLEKAQMSISKSTMAPMAFHAAFRRDPDRAFALCRARTGIDANSFMERAYSRSVDQFIASCGGLYAPSACENPTFRQSVSKFFKRHRSRWLTVKLKALRTVLRRWWSMLARGGAGRTVN